MAIGTNCLTILGAIIVTISVDMMQIKLAWVRCNKSTSFATNSFCTTVFPSSSSASCLRTVSI